MNILNILLIMDKLINGMEIIGINDNKKNIYKILIQNFIKYKENQFKKQFIKLQKEQINIILTKKNYNEEIKKNDELLNYKKSLNNKFFNLFKASSAIIFSVFLFSSSYNYNNIEYFIDNLKLSYLYSAESFIISSFYTFSLMGYNKFKITKLKNTINQFETKQLLCYRIKSIKEISKDQFKELLNKNQINIKLKQLTFDNNFY